MALAQKGTRTGMSDPRALFMHELGDTLTAEKTISEKLSSNVRPRRD